MLRCSSVHRDITMSWHKDFLFFLKEKRAHFVLFALIKKCSFYPFVCFGSFFRMLDCFRLSWHKPVIVSSSSVLPYRVVVRLSNVCLDTKMLKCLWSSCSKMFHCLSRSGNTRAFHYKLFHCLSQSSDSRAFHCILAVQ